MAVDVELARALKIWGSLEGKDPDVLLNEILRKSIPSKILELSVTGSQEPRSRGSLESWVPGPEDPELGAAGEPEVLEPMGPAAQGAMEPRSPNDSAAAEDDSIATQKKRYRRSKRDPEIEAKIKTAWDKGIRKNRAIVEETGIPDHKVTRYIDGMKADGLI